MKKILKSIRKKQFTEKKIIKYIFYGFGESVLIIIGILTALWINNINEAKKNEHKIISILEKIQENLVLDIESTVYILDEYIKDDSLQYLVMNDKITPDYYSNEANILGIQSIVCDLRKSQFNNLIRNSEIIPLKYEYLLADLDLLYEEYGNLVEIDNNIVLQSVFSFMTYFDDQDWSIDFEKNIINDQALDYFLKSNHYKRTVKRHMANFKSLFIDSQIYREKAVKIYLKINEIIESQKAIPNYIKNSPDSIFFENLISKRFHILDQDGLGFDQEVEFLIQNDFLKLKLEDNLLDLEYHSNEILYNLDFGFYIKFENADKSIFTLSKGINGRVKYGLTDQH